MPTDPNVAAPQWFTDAISTPGERHSLEVDGATIVYRTWGDAGAPGVLLVHGGGAHGGWWDHLAPQLAAGRRVVALDLSGAVEGAKAELEESEAWARLKASSKSVEWRRSASGLRLEVLLKLHDYDGAVVRAHAVRLRRLCCWLGRRRVIARWRRR